MNDVLTSDSHQLSCRLEKLTGSVAREILSTIKAEDIISFAGGMPDSAALESLDNLYQLDASSFQYGPSEGDLELRKGISKLLNRRGIKNCPEDILVTNGSQQGLDLIAKLFVDRGSAALVEKPTYLAALQVFKLFQAKLHSIDVNSSGIDLDLLEAKLRSENPRFIYLNPTFQNPSGICYPDSIRRSVAALLDEYNVPLVEDEPYYSLNYEGFKANPTCSYLQKAPFAYLSTVSKILAPGLRIGYLVCSPGFYPHLLKLKQAADLHSNQPAQQWVAKIIADTQALEEREKFLRSHYRKKRDFMQDCLKKELGNRAEWQKPDGGMFFWIRLKSGVDTRELLRNALSSGMAFMPGDPFFVNAEAGRQYMRLNFTHPSREEIEKGMAILGRVVQESN